MTIEQYAAIALGLLPIIGIAVAMIVHIVRESRRIDRRQPCKGLGREQRF